MNMHLTALFLGVLLGAGSVQDAKLSGVYVNEKSPYDRVEFLPDGKCFRRDRQGVYTKEKDVYVCRCGGDEEVRFHREGAILVDGDGNRWVPRETIAKMPWKNVSPVTLVVLDRETQKPIPRFRYEYTISTPKAEYDPLFARGTEVRRDDGTFTLLAPESCEIGMQVKGETILGGYGTWRSYHLTTDNKYRKIEVLVETGVTVQGTVVDARTGKPVQGARVAPTIFRPPLFSPEWDRAVKTDADGKFTLQGVDGSLGIDVAHPDYLDSGCRDLEKNGKKVGEKLYGARIALESGEKLTGVVKDPAGKPLAGVKVSDGAGKQVRTDKDGSFVLASPKKCWNDGTAYELSFEKPGYLDQELHPKAADPKGFSVVLQPMPELAGQVLAPDGRPVETFDVSAGIGREPAGWKCSSRKIHDAEGRFSLPVSTVRDYDNEKKVWIGVKAPGFAFWETTIDVWQGTTSVAVRLKSGVAVHGTIKNPKDRSDKMFAMLLPCRLHKEECTSETSQRQKLGRMETPIDDNGVFRFNHVASGEYLLAISGPAISPISVGIAVAGSDLNAGGFSTQGRGSVSGVVYQDKMICDGETCRLDENRGLWAFAEGHVSFHDTSGRCNADEFTHLRPIPFKADEKGRFHIDGVPVGNVSVGIPYNITSDIIGTHGRTAKVMEGKTTEVRFFDTSGDWDVKCKFVVGDGTPAQFASGSGENAKRKAANVTTRAPMFLVELKPKEDTTISCCESDWETLDEHKQMLLRDVQPGKYRVTVREWQGSTGLHEVAYEGDADVKSGGTMLTIPLGAGCITGAVECSKDYRYMIHVITAGKKTGAIRHAYCDEQGNFCVRYLPADDYTLWAHDYDAGWCKMANAAVKNNTTDIGSHKLVAGGTIAGKLPPRFATDHTVTVVATDPHGIPIEQPNHFDPIGREFAISSLWPGQWTVVLKKGEAVIAEKTTTLRGDEKVSCDLAGE